MVRTVLFVHQKKDHPNAPKVGERYKCNYDGCNFKCCGPYLLAKHKFKEHQILNAAYSCDLCGKISYTRADVIQCYYSMLFLLF